AGHEKPPPTKRGRACASGDQTFDRRFAARGDAGMLARLWDEEARGRAAAIIDGWVAHWAGRGVVLRMTPGQGAPLDQPIPVTKLAFSGEVSEGATDRLLGVLDLLIGVAQRAHVQSAADAEGAS